MQVAFDYAVIRIVPRTEREEFFNAGVILFSSERRFLDARVHLDEAKLRALGPELSSEDIGVRLRAIIRICRGDVEAGPIAQLPQRARFHWLVAPRSTQIQVSAVRTGMCSEPQEALDRLFRQLRCAGPGSG